MFSFIADVAVGIILDLAADRLGERPRKRARQNAAHGMAGMGAFPVQHRLCK